MMREGLLKENIDGEALIWAHQRLAVDVFLEQPLAHHQAEVLARAPPGLVG